MAVPARTLERPRPRPRPEAPRRRTRGSASRRSSPAAGARRRSRRVPFLVFALLVTTAMVVLVAAAQALVAQGAFRMSELEEKAVRLEQEYGRLRLDLARLSSPERVRRAALEAGLVLPGEVEILAIRMEDESGPRPPAEETLALPGAGGGSG